MEGAVPDLLEPEYGVEGGGVEGGGGCGAADFVP